MDWLNYHHLYYFWVVAKEGTVTAASERLRLAQPTISAQVRRLEQSLGTPLFTRKGRSLVLTDTGRLVYQRADEIFSLGRDLMSTVKGLPREQPRVRLNIGVVDVLPKLVAYRLIEPAMRVPEAVCVVCQEGKHSDLLARLAVYELDIVLSDTPIGSHVKVRAFNHLLGECGITIFGTKALAAQYKRGFPESLNGAPFLLPTANTSLRRTLDAWFEGKGITPAVVGEFEDTALIEEFGQIGFGLFVTPSAVEDDVQHHHHVVRVGRVPEVVERFYAISSERRIKHPAVLAITQGAQERFFA